MNYEVDLRIAILAALILLQQGGVRDVEHVPLAVVHDAFDRSPAGSQVHGRLRVGPAADDDGTFLSVEGIEANIYGTPGLEEERRRTLHAPVRPDLESFALAKKLVQRTVGVAQAVKMIQTKVGSLCYDGFTLHHKWNDSMLNRSDPQHLFWT